MRPAAILLCAVQLAAAGNPALGPRQKLFNGKNLDGFYTFIRGQGVDRDPEGIFQVNNGVIRVSGQSYGYFSTKTDHENYYLLVEFRWGEKTWPPREGKARDSEILFHVSGEDKIWPKSVEFQIIEGGTGDVILVDGTTLTVKGETKSSGRFDRFGKGEWKDVAGYRDPGREVEKPRGEWNKLELWSEGDSIRYHVNGVLVNEGANASVRRGRILFQSEGAEVFFRKIELRPIKPR